MKHPKYYDSQKEATARYNRKAYDRINVIVKKGQRQIIKDFAASQGKSLNRFICDAIDAEMKKQEKPSEPPQRDGSLGFFCPWSGDRFPYHGLRSQTLICSAFSYSRR